MRHLHLDSPLPHCPALPDKTCVLLNDLFPYKSGSRKTSSLLRAAFRMKEMPSIMSKFIARPMESSQLSILGIRRFASTADED